MYQQLADLINSNVSSANAKVNGIPEEGAGHESISVAPESIYDVCVFLKNCKEYPCRALQVISGVDYKDYLENIIEKSQETIETHNRRFIRAFTYLMATDYPKLVSH